MGFKWNIGQAALGLALLVGVAAADAAPSREPLVETRLQDPEDHLIVTSSSSGEPTLNDRIALFAQALGDATAAQEQVMQAQCKSAAAVPAGGPARLAWEANCRYRRR
jgi:hypothetical protein